MLRKRAAFRCTCPGPARARVHNATNEKCNLFPTKLGERRWPGSNMGVTEADLDFLKAYQTLGEISK